MRSSPGFKETERAGKFVICVHSFPKLDGCITCAKKGILYLAYKDFRGSFLRMDKCV